MVLTGSSSTGDMSRSFWIGLMYTLDLPTRSCVARGECRALGATNSNKRELLQHRIISKPPASLSFGNVWYNFWQYSSGPQSMSEKDIFLSPRPASSNSSRSKPVLGGFDWLQLARHTKGCVHDVVLLLERLAVGGFPKMGRFPFLLSVSYAPKFRFCSLEAFSLKLLRLLSARDAFSCMVTTSGTRNREIGWQVTITLQQHLSHAGLHCPLQVHSKK